MAASVDPQDAIIARLRAGELHAALERAGFRTRSSVCHPSLSAAMLPRKPSEHKNPMLIKASSRWMQANAASIAPPSHLTKQGNEVGSHFWNPQDWTKHGVLQHGIVRLIMTLALVIIVFVVAIEIANLALQNVHVLLKAKTDKPIQLLIDSLSAITALSSVSTTDTGYAPLNDDLVMEYRMYLAPNYMDEQAMFPVYIDALTHGRYRALSGTTKLLWNQTHDIRSAMGGIDYAIDWWDLVSTTMDVQGTVLFTGATTNSTMLNMSCGALIDHFQLDPTTGRLNDAAMNALLPRTSIAKRSQLTALMFKQYATDPRNLPSFNLRIAADEWLAGMGARDFMSTSGTNATCVLRERPSYVWFVYGYWRPPDFYPGDNYKARYTNASVGDWVIECDTPNILFTAKNIRWYGGMKNRYSTLFYHMAVQMQSTRRVFFTQQTLLNMTTAINGYEVPIRKIVSMPSDGKLTPLPSSIYVVETESVADIVRNVWIGLVFLVLVCIRWSFIGFRTLLHFTLESPLSNVLDLTYAVVTIYSGIERSMLLADMAVDTSLMRIVYMAAAMRPFTTPAMLMSKAFLSLFFGTKHITPFVSVREGAALLVVQIVLLSSTSRSIVAAGMYPKTTVDDVTSYVWRFHTTMLAITFGVVYARYIVDREVNGFWQRRVRPVMNVVSRHSSRSRSAMSDRRSFHAKQVSEASHQQQATPVGSTELLAYDEYVGGSFFGFSVCFVPRTRVQGRWCRVLDGRPLWLEALVNFNGNGPIKYNSILHTGHVIGISSIGHFTISDVELVTVESYALDPGVVILG